MVLKLINIVWMDLEFPSFHQGQIFECVVIIIDKDLNEIQISQLH